MIGQSISVYLKGFVVVWISKKTATNNEGFDVFEHSVHDVCSLEGGFTRLTAKVEHLDGDSWTTFVSNG